MDVFSIEGRKLKTFKIENNKRINLNLSSGLYILKVSSEGKMQTQKIVIN